MSVSALLLPRNECLHDLFRYSGKIRGAHPIKMQFHANRFASSRARGESGRLNYRRLLFFVLQSLLRQYRVIPSQCSFFFTNFYMTKYSGVIAAIFAARRIVREIASNFAPRRINACKSRCKRQQYEWTVCQGRHMTWIPFVFSAKTQRACICSKHQIEGYFHVIQVYWYHY